MKDVTIHLSVEDSEVDGLLEQLTAIVDDEGDRGQWTYLAFREAEWGNGGTLPTQHAVKVDAFGVDR